jgi:S-DNA-T family DNA segregation ATPase FtsK/SpoIIIE
VDVVTGLIKANIPSRIALTVSTAVDSRTIIDTVGADKLLGQGDMLFAPVGSNKPLRVQGCYVSDEEISSIVEFVKKTKQMEYDTEIIEEIERNAANTGDQKEDDGERSGETDPMMDEAIKVVVEAGQASTSLLQRRLRLGYARAGRLIDEMEQLGIVGPHEGSKPRQVLMTYTQWLERNMQKPDQPDDGEE